MIDEVLEVIRGEIDTFLKLKMKEGHEQYIKLVPVVDQDGKPALNENSISMSLVKIEEDRTNMSNALEEEHVNGRVLYFNPPVKLNLYILFTATYTDGQEKNYKEALKRLAYVISFFQSKSVFTPQNSPKLDSSHRRIVVELHTQSFEQQNNLWSMLGNNYRPSVLYRLRALLIQERQVTAAGEPVEGYDIDIIDKDAQK